ncbi:MAG: DUF5011 domain-containing protein [Candidatus Nitrosoabyssus spongiisocia]|nr:MAG: DUF5011 domain-containing protein [Nitrosopumilaceae archaeon AB1(1)]
MGNGLNFYGLYPDYVNYLDLPDLAGSLFYNTDFTISVWANIGGNRGFARFVDFGNGLAQDNIVFQSPILDYSPYANTDLTYDMLRGNVSQNVTISGVLQKGQWAYFTVVHESSGTATIYHNGTSITSGAVHTSNDVNRTTNYIGKINWVFNQFFNGKLDEFRLSSTARSADWIATEYANQNSPSTFFTISTPEDRSVVITSAITNTQGDNIIITFNENITYSATITDFALNGTSATIDSITSNSSSITLNLSRNLLANETIIISYTKTSGGINSTQNTDITLENFVNQPVINNISDTTPPVITLNGNNVVYVELGSSYSEQNATTDDGSPVTIGGDTVNSSLVGNYTVTYDSVDSAGNNATQVNRLVIVSDTIPPVITLNGNSTITLFVGSTYNEQNATTDDNSPVTIGGDTVNSSLKGNYTVTYNSVDSAGNNATQVDRTVIISDAPDDTPPVITLIGNATVYVELGSSYSEQNATTDDGSPVTIGGDTVNSSLVGNYTVTYDSVDSAGNNATQVNRLVIVSDTIPPVITLNGNSTITLFVGATYNEQNATTDDNSPVTISGDTVNSSLVGNYTVTYDSVDSAGNNATQVNRLVIVSDTIPPVITLNGNSTITLNINSTYNEQNATTDDDSPIVIGGDTVNSSLVGNYTVTYDSVDSAGNNATQVNRTIVVSDTIPPVITLNGSSTITLNINSTYNEQNATTDDDSPIVIGGDTVDTDTVGNYTITYNSVDSAGNNAVQVNRIIVVRDTIRPTVVNTPIYDTLAHTLTVTFSENVIIPNSSRLGITSGAFTTTNVDSTNNPTLVFTFSNNISEHVVNTNLQHSSGANVHFPTDSVLDAVNNGIFNTENSLNVQSNVTSSDQMVSPTLLHIDVPLIVTPEHQNVTINYIATTLNTTNITAGLTAKLVSTNDITVMIPTSTIITHDGTWDSQFLAPRTATITVPSTTAGQTTTSHVTITAITLGDVTIDLNLGDTVVSIVFENQGGNNYNAYYVNTIGSTPTQMSSCGTSNIAEINTLLTTTSTNECFVDDNTHVTIYTTHLSTYALTSSTGATSTQVPAPIPFTSSGDGSSSGGGGAGRIFTGGQAPIIAEAIIHKVSWEVS